MNPVRSRMPKASDYNIKDMVSNGMNEVIIRKHNERVYPVRDQ
jgi:hypothetical protein